MTKQGLSIYHSCGLVILVLAILASSNCRERAIPDQNPLLEVEEVPEPRRDDEDTNTFVRPDDCDECRAVGDLDFPSGARCTCIGNGRVDLIEDDLPSAWRAELRFDERIRLVWSRQTEYGSDAWSVEQTLSWSEDHLLLEHRRQYHSERAVYEHHRYEYDADQFRVGGWHDLNGSVSVCQYTNCPPPYLGCAPTGCVTTEGTGDGTASGVAP